LVDRQIVATRLSKLRESLKQLERIAAMDQQAYLASQTDRALADVKQVAVVIGRLCEDAGGS